VGRALVTSAGSRLEASLRRDIAAWSKLHGIPVAIHCNGLVNADLPETVGAAVDHVVTEGLRNVAFHASARRCSVYVRRDAAVLRVLVEDDGAGFQVARNYRDGGLGRLRDRARALGATFLLESRKGKGTSVGMEVRL
jgi:two-component system sensor histidine kinase UhpB